MPTYDLSRPLIVFLVDDKTGCWTWREINKQSDDGECEMRVFPGQEEMVARLIGATPGVLTQDCPDPDDVLAHAESIAAHYGTKANTREYAEYISWFMADSKVI